MSSSVQVLTDAELNELATITHEGVAELERSGYTLAGGVRYTARGMSAQALLMIGPARDRVSSLGSTPFGPMMAIGSESSTGRRVVSRNGSFWELPDWELCNDVPAAGPRRLDEAHTAALNRLRRVFEPRIRSDETTVEELAAGLEAYLGHFESFRGTYGPFSGFGAIGDDPRSRRRIRKWLSAEPALRD